MPLPAIHYLTDIYFGAGQVRVLSEILEKVGIRRPFVVTDVGLQNLGLVERLDIESAVVFAKVPTNPTEESVLAGLAMFREHQADGVLAFGGGSPMDCAKCIALLETHPGPLEQYALIRDGAGRITANKPPVIAIPTTAGTGSEVGRGALVTMSNGKKLGVISKHMIPQVALCDPEFTVYMPPMLTAATGMDAISHCVETYCSPKFNPVADAISLDGLARAWRNLPGVLEHPEDVVQRSEMMMASMQGALAFQKGLGLIHSLSHPLGALSERTLHHGMLNAVFLPHVLRFNAGACPDRMVRMSQALGLRGGAERLADAFSQLIERIGLPTRLVEMGVTRQDLEGIPGAAMEDHSTPSNPRPFTVADCRAVLDAAY